MPHVLGNDLGRCLDKFATGHPFGDDVKYDPLYQDLRAEVQKLTAMSSANGSLDWKSVKKWSIEILSSKSKDLTVASYLTVALFYLDGYGGLADGLEILNKLLKDDWDGMFPAVARPRNRALALEWLVSRLAQYVEVKAPQPDEAPLLEPVREQVAALQETARQRLLHEAPSFSAVASALASHLPQPASSAPAGESPISPALPSSVPAGTSPGPPTPSPLAPGTPADEVVDRIRTLIPALRHADPYSPIPYRLLRVLKWDAVAAAPPLDPNANNPETTRIPPPRPPQRAALESLHASASWAALLEASEAAFQDVGGTFWLDLQRYSVAALEGLDPKAGVRAAEAVKEEIAHLLKRVGTLPTLFFADRTPPAPAGRPAEKTVERTPFADDETRRWLETLQGEAAAEPAGSLIPLARITEVEELGLSPDHARTVQDLLARQQTAAAFDLLQAAVERASGPRARFRTRLVAARLCLQANQAGSARHLLEELLEESGTLRFDEWEPEIAADLYQLLALCYARPAKKGGPADPDAARARIETLRRKLSRLDLRAAAALDEALRR